MTRRDKPTERDFKNFWSVFEAKQAQKKKTIHPSNTAKNSKE